MSLTVMSTLAILNLLGFSLDQISVAGLIVSLGLLVDNAIVVVDTTRNHSRAGLSAHAAAGLTLRELWAPLLSSTATTALAFMPIVLLPGNVGEFIGAIGVSVVVALLCSYFLAFTLIPGFCALALKSEPSKPGYQWFLTGVELPRVRRLFARSLDLSLRWPRLSIACASLAPILGFLVAPTMTQQFFPDSDRDQVRIELRMPASASIWATDEAVRRAEAILGQFPDVLSTTWFVGASAPPVYYNLIADKFRTPNYAEALILVASPEAIASVVPALQQALDEGIPEAQAVVRTLAQGPRFDAPIEIRVSGRELETLQSLGQRLQAILAQTPGVIHTRATIPDGVPSLALHIDEDKAALLGLNLRNIARQLDGAVDGSTRTSLVEGTQSLPVRVRFARPDQLGTNILGSMHLGLAGPPLIVDDQLLAVPLAELGTLELVASLPNIMRRDQERLNIVKGYIRANILPQEVMHAFRTRLTAEGIVLPAGYSRGGLSSGEVPSDNTEPP